jgi:nicotinate phosphoribosyltransferase
MHPPGSALLTDLYQLTMAHAYWELGMRETATFELFVRRLPAQRNFLIAAGLEQAVEYLESLRFEPAEIDYLASLGGFSREFLHDLSRFRFTGSLHAMPEGTPVFADEPLLRVTAPILEAQIVESRLMNIVHFESTIASKAARCALAGGGRRLVDFGMRRAHGAEAALLAARAAYLAGFDATATVEAGRLFGIPVTGTMAHSFVQAHESELEAFRNFVNARPQGAAVLIDTYDTERAAHIVVALAAELARAGRPRVIQAVRIDSGDLAVLSRTVRAILDAGDCREVKIVLSGGLDESKIEELLRAGASVDAFGVGTSLDASTDAPTLDMAYKLEEYAGLARRKRSTGKATWPGRKQVWRDRGADGKLARDTVALETEHAPGEPLLREVMRAGRRCVALPDLEEARAHCKAQLEALPSEQRSLAAARPYPVVISDGVRALAERVDAAHSATGRTT